MSTSYQISKMPSKILVIVLVINPSRAIVSVFVRFCDLLLLLKHCTVVVIWGKMVGYGTKWEGREGRWEGDPYTYKTISWQIIITVQIQN